MKRRLMSVIVFAVLAATVSSTILYKVISAGTTHAAQTSTARVFVATRDLNAGVLLAESDVREESWPVTGESPWVGRRSDVVGRALLTSLSKGEPVAESRLASKGSGGGVASRIPPGMRAVAVHVDELTGLSRFILPGMHVDVISTGNTGAQGMVARTILQNVEVFSNGQADPKDKVPGVPVFNLLVTPKQAELLSQAVVQTRIQLVLRNPMDTASIVAETLPQPAPPLPKAAAARKAPPAKKIVAEVEKPAALPPPPQVAAPAPPSTLEIIQGTKRTVSAVAPGSEHK